MAFAASLAELHAEASCPLCLDYLRDPVTIACGHNFCLQCIQQCWEDLQHILPCPVCLHHCPDRNFRRNTQLCHVTGFVRQLPGARSKRNLQEEKLRVFFKKRRELFSHYRLKRRLFKKTE